MICQDGKGDRGRRRRRFCVLSVGALGIALRVAAAGQELEPRAYSPSPVGTNFLVLNFSRSTGSAIFDPTIPITDISAHLNAPAVGLGRTFGIRDRQALVTVALPYVWGDVSGMVEESQGRITRSGLADCRVKLSVNLLGAPAQSPEEFAKTRHREFLFGTSLTVQPPSGQYDRTKLVNLGTNRWGIKPEAGISIPLKKLDVDLYGGAWFFSENPAFYPGGSTRTENPITVLQAHASYTIRRQMWIAVDGTWYVGGAASVNGGPEIGEQDNSRFGATFSLPLIKGQSLKFAYAAGATARTGSNFDTVSVAWQFLWFGLRP